MLLIRDTKKKYFDDLANNLNSDQLSSKDWWNTIKSFISTNNKPSIPALNDNGTTVSDPKLKADLLNNYFKCQSTLNDDGQEPPLLESPINILSNLVITRDEVCQTLISLQQVRRHQTQM